MTALSLLRALAGPAGADAIEGDLRERSAGMRQRHGDAAADAWLRREVLRSIPPLARERWHAACAARDALRIAIAAVFGYGVVVLGTVASALLSQRPAALPPFSLAAIAAMYSPLGLAGAAFVFAVAGAVVALACGRGAWRSALLVAAITAFVGAAVVVATPSGSLLGGSAWRFALPLPCLLLGCIAAASIRNVLPGTGTSSAHAG
jgi:hypothetical protein